MLTRLTSLLVDMRVQSWKDDISLPDFGQFFQEAKDNISEFTKNLPFHNTES